MTRVVTSLPFPSNDHSDLFSFSVLSFNILAQCFTKTQHGHPQIPMEHLWWEKRGPEVMHKLQASDCDIICLQEVEAEIFNDELTVALAPLGYAGVLQDNKNRKESHTIGNAIFFKSSKFRLVWAEHKTRSLILGLEFHQNHIIAIGNCHLQALHEKESDRLSQMQSLVKHVNLHPHDSVIMCGDFNASASSTVCAFLSNQPCQKWLLKNAFNQDLNIFEPTSSNYYILSRIDHIWFDSITLTQDAILDYASTNDALKQDVLNRNIPSVNWPSDHLLIASQFSFHPTQHHNQQEAEKVLEEVALSESEVREWTILEESRPPKGKGKPTDQEMEIRKKHKQQEKLFLETLGAGKRALVKQLVKQRVVGLDSKES